MLFEDQKALIHSIKWDYLIILDACRSDIFQQENFLKGKYKTVLSPASHTAPWRNKVFPDKYPFTVYSGTPMIASSLKIEGFKGEDHFLKVIEIWKDYWDENLSTVPCWSVYDVAKTAKPRSIIWFIQPHLPCIGEKKLIPKFFTGKDTRHGDLVIIQQLEAKKIAPQDIRNAYRDNIRIVLEYVDKLIKHYTGKIIITADHGELLGEQGYWLHPKMMVHEVLRLVPWLEIER